MRQYGVKLIGTGSYLPGEPVPFSNIMDVLGPITGAPPKVQRWIDAMGPLMEEMLEIKHAYYGIDPVTRQFTESNITMAVKAARKAMEAAGVTPADIDFIAYGSGCQDQMPTASVRIQEELGIKECGEISIHSNCTSAYKTIMLAHDLISLGRYKTVMAISSNMSSSFLRSEFFNPKVIEKNQMLLRWFLCDGAGCMIFTRDESKEKHGAYIEASFTESVGCGTPSMMYNRLEGRGACPLEVYEKGLHHIVQEGITIEFGESRERGKDVGELFISGIKKMVAQFDIDLSKTTFFQINFPARHIHDILRERCIELGVPENSFYSRLSDYAYPGPPAAFIAVDKILREEQLKPADQIISFVTEVSKFMQAGFMLKHY